MTQGKDSDLSDLKVEEQEGDMTSNSNQGTRETKDPTLSRREEHEGENARKWLGRGYPGLT